MRPITGTRLTLLELVTRLCGEHEVTMVGYVWPEQAASDLPDEVEVHQLPAPPRTRIRRLRYWLRGFRFPAPLQSEGLVSPMAERLRELLAARSFDLVHVTAAPLAGLAPALDPLPKVMVALDAWNLNARSQTAASPFYLKPIRRLEERRIESFSQRFFPRYDAVVTVSDEDAAELERLGIDSGLRVIPNGVDTLAFYPDWDAEKSSLIVFVGTMRWAPNIHAAEFLGREILPRVRRSVPDAEVAIVGRSAPPDVRESLEALDGVRVVGEVPDVGDWLRKAAVFCCPMLDGTGIKNKLLEAFACGTPAVATALACQGLRVTHGQQLLVAEDAGGLATAIVRLLTDRTEAERLGRRGREYVERFHRWDAVTTDYVAVYRQVAEAK